LRCIGHPLTAWIRVLGRRRSGSARSRRPRPETRIQYCRMQDLFTPSILVAALVFVLSLVLSRLFLLPATQRWFLDHPNQRSLHASPVPRTGGLGLVPGLAVGLLIIRADAVLVAITVGLMLLSVLDD